MALLQSRPAPPHANGSNGPKDMKLKMGLSLRAAADTTRRVCASRESAARSVWKPVGPPNRAVP